MILRWRSPLHRKSCFSIVFRAKAVACSAVCRLSRDSDIQARMIARRAVCSGFMTASLTCFVHVQHHDIRLVPLGRGLVPRAPFWTAAALIVRLGPILVRGIAQCSPPGIRQSRSRLHDREVKRISHGRELSVHRNPRSLGNLASRG
jgi:hypothetical protein